MAEFSVCWTLCSTGKVSAPRSGQFVSSELEFAQGTASCPPRAPPSDLSEWGEY